MSYFQVTKMQARDLFFKVICNLEASYIKLGKQAFLLFNLSVVATLMHKDCQITLTKKYYSITTFSPVFLQMNVDPEDLIPKLPKPKDLQPFPTTQAIVSTPVPSLFAPRVL